MGMSAPVSIGAAALEGPSGWSPSLRTALARAAADQQGRLFLWSPVALVVGIGAYFSLGAEPSIVLVSAAAGLAALLLWFGRNTQLVLLAGLVAFGFVLAKVRTEMVATPLLAATTGEVIVTGRVAAVDQTSRGRLALTLEPDAIEGLAADRVPVRLRLSLPLKFGKPATGSRVALQARLSPLPTPVMPGGFDYARRLYFERIGGMGRVTQPVTVLSAEAPVWSSLGASLVELRMAMGERIKAALDEPYDSFAEALITGERANIPPDMNRSLLVSGLFHILSISGLHMWLVAGGVFWGMRAALAAVPVLALRWPIKKWAAAAALGMGLFYMLLAEGGVATQRSFAMIAVVFFAVLVDRPALSVRNLAIAALAILILEPESAVDASFQMSFLAVLGLVAFYEAWSRYRRSRDGGERRERHWSVRVAQVLAAGTAASLATTLIAGVMSSIPAVYHFGRISPYGLIANGLAIPVVGVAVMPPALIAALLMPFGLEGLPLWVMGQGLRLVMAISDFVASLPGADAVSSQPPPLAIAMIASGAILSSLLVGWIRLIGLPVAMAGLALLAMPHGLPDILIERAGQNVALRNAGDLLVPAYPRRARFAVQKWLAANGEEQTPVEAASRPGWTCSDGRCESIVKTRRIVYLSRLEGKPFDCAGADILIADFPLRGTCRAVPLRIDRFDLWRSGAHAVLIGADGVTVATARAAQGKRPWAVVPERRRTAFVPPSRQQRLSPD